MIRKMVNGCGSLHDRINKSILLNPFTLAETVVYLHATIFTQKVKTTPPISNVYSCMRCMPNILLLAYCAHLLGPGIGFWVHAAAHWVHEGHFAAHHHQAAESGAHHPHTGQAGHHHSPLVLLWQHRPASDGGDAVLAAPAPLAGAWHLPAAPLPLCARYASVRAFAPRHPVVGPGNKYADALLPVDDPPPKGPAR